MNIETKRDCGSARTILVLSTPHYGGNTLGWQHLSRVPLMQVHSLSEPQTGFQLVGKHVMSLMTFGQWAAKTWSLAHTNS
jgi:hypothetical protein